MILNYNPILSCIFSLLLIKKFYNLAFKSSKIVGNFLNNKNFFFISIVNFFLIISFLSLITFFYILIFPVNLFLIKSISYSIILFGLFKPIYLKKFSYLLKRDNLKIKIIYLLLVSYCILSLSPITDPDSLDYHVTIPQYIISYEDNQFPNYWLTSQLSGICEILLIYGLAIGALNFSQILQFTSLLFIILIILNFRLKKNIDNEKILYICLCILTIPAVVFLISTSKPQIFPIAINFIALILTCFYLTKNDNKLNSKYFFIIIYLLFVTTQIKYSFYLSSGLIVLLTVYELYKKNYSINKIIIICFLCFSFVILPREIYEYLYFNPNIFYNFFNAHTDLFSSKEYNLTLKTNTGNTRLIPIWMFIPKSLSQITYSLGVVILYLFFIINFKFNKKILIISTSYIFIGLILAQPVGRFFIEPFLWLLFFSIFNFKIYFKKLNVIFERIIILYSALFFIILSFFALNLFKANFGDEIYEEVLTKNADGFTLYKWANDILPDNAVLISTHRAHAFYKNKVISYEFRNFKNSYSEDGKEYYLDSIINENQEFIMYTSQNLNNDIDFFKTAEENFLQKRMYIKKLAETLLQKEKNLMDIYIL